CRPKERWHASLSQRVETNNWARGRGRRHKEGSYDSHQRTTETCGEAWRPFSDCAWWSSHDSRRSNRSNSILLSTTKADSSTRRYLYKHRKDTIVCRAEGGV